MHAGSCREELACATGKDTEIFEERRRKKPPWEEEEKEKGERRMGENSDRWERSYCWGSDGEGECKSIY
jgi:hypothetical protein